MQVTLLHYTPLYIGSQAIRTCWDSGDKSDAKNDCGQIGCVRYPNKDIDKKCLNCELQDIEIGEKDKALIYRVGNKFKHSSTLEHITFNFFIEGISRALLQELARHRMANLSVKSTRYTLKELKDGFIFSNRDYDNMLVAEAKKYLVLTGNQDVDFASIQALVNLQELLKKGISNDIAKYALPESYKTSLTWTVNLRSLQNIVSLRSDKSALWEYRDLIKEILKVIPKEFIYLLEEFDKNKD